MDVLEQDLRALGLLRASDGFAKRVLAAVGLPAPASDAYAEVDTPAGRFHVAWGAAGISAVRRVGAPADFERWFGERRGRPVARAAEVPAQLLAQLAAGTAGRSRGLRLDLGGLRPFERDVLQKTLEIPRGEVRTYAWVAREIGRPRAVRAVGTALGRNPLPVLIPCHRVIRADGTLGEYSGGGTEAKRSILRQEGVDPAWLEHLAATGTRFIGSLGTGVFCMPTCRHVRRMQAANRVPLRDEREAIDAGFRPCAACRPMAGTGSGAR